MAKRGTLIFKIESTEILSLERLSKVISLTLFWSLDRKIKIPSNMK